MSSKLIIFVMATKRLEEKTYRCYILGFYTIFFKFSFGSLGNKRNKCGLNNRLNMLINKNTQRMSIDRWGLPPSRVASCPCPLEVCKPLLADAAFYHPGPLPEDLSWPISPRYHYLCEPFFKISVQLTQLSTSVSLSCDCLFIHMSPAVVYECQEDRNHFDPFWSVYYGIELEGSCGSPLYHQRYYRTELNRCSLVERTIVNSHYPY